MIDNLPPQRPGDVRGLLCFIEPLPQPWQGREDSTEELDFRRSQANWGRPFRRDATATERELLAALGYGPLPGDLYCDVANPSGGLRMRRWPQIEGPAS